MECLHHNMTNMVVTSGSLFIQVDPVHFQIHGFKIHFMRMDLHGAITSASLLWFDEKFVCVKHHISILSYYLLPRWQKWLPFWVHFRYKWIWRNNIYQFVWGWNDKFVWVQHHAMRFDIFAVAVCIISNDRMTYTLAVYSKLMPAACNWQKVIHFS